MMIDNNNIYLQTQVLHNIRGRTPSNYLKPKFCTLNNIIIEYIKLLASHQLYYFNVISAHTSASLSRIAESSDKGY